MLRAPQFVYGSPATTVSLSVAQRPWTATERTEGGSERATSGVREVFLLRRDHLLNVTLRIRESEFTALAAMVRYAQESAPSFTFRPNGDATTPYTVELETPTVGEDFSPTRDEYNGALEVTLVLRRTDGGTWDALRYYA